MPLMAIHLPTRFLTEQEDYAKKLLHNEDKLTTAYDIHMTLKDIIDTRRLSQSDTRDEGRFGQSLFKPIAADRTCKSAGVDMHWCACLKQFPVKGDQVQPQALQDSLLNALNQKTSEHRQVCVAYDSVTLVNVTRIVPNEEVLKYESDTNQKFTVDTLLDTNYYQVTAKVTSKKDADGGVGKHSELYEATFMVDSSSLIHAIAGDSYKLASDIIRLNKASKTCTNDHDMMRYCSCA